MFLLTISDDEILTRNITDYTTNIEEIEGVKVIGDVMSAIQYVSQNEPNVIMLDYDLASPSGNALSFLTKYHDLKLTTVPYILVLTMSADMCTLDVARLLGADLLVKKRDPAYVIETIRMLESFVDKRCNVQPAPLSAAEKQKRERLTVSRNLDMLGFNPKMIGYQYIIDAIMMAYEVPRPNITKALEESVGKSAASIERAMQNAIARTWERGDGENLRKYYTAPIQSRKKCPTLTEFVYYFANKLRVEGDVFIH